MPSRNRVLSSHGLWLVLVAASACIDAQEDNRASQPPPIVGSGTRTNTAQPAGTGSAAKGGTAGTSPGTRTQTMAVSAADGGQTVATPAEADLDAGPASAGSAGSSAAGSSGAVAAGSGGAGGRGGAGGQAGAAGAMPSAACMNQLCFTLIDCWLLSSEDCNYVACDNFVCK
jgi:hypothetical protein